ncbi:tRNA (guanosine(46)-N7)-methyltransferase TrmB [Candidatus Formimonas warabiya]|uniref:tRNA (guanine-N(7)-)-methyltransferase n=1 Tax=Formimonas warabiya TaxID=1761012 RepID=A0A3G1KMJ4_FORW1|nr:tRNA (guanosine(46)-N7)-methyltransferase TrmB [Candidatus Formimonas warabiya]ATW23667.1 tRNA (guanosine(46)-N7)-methyltransferase TrmB [Candidatus Formimonas warabiya]
MRLRRIPGTKEALGHFPDLVIGEPSRYYGSWNQFFGNEHPIHLELGMGKGKFLHLLSQAHPHLNFLGMEFREEMVYKAVERFKGRHDHVGFLWANVDKILEFFAPGEISRIYLNFSDPWPKKRHEKRRLTHGNFLKKYQIILSPGGEIHLKTDNQDFFEFSLNAFADGGFFLKNITFDLHHSNFPGNMMTEYEERYSPVMPIYRCEAKLTTP